MKIGVDCGGSYTDCVALDGRKVAYTFSCPSREFNEKKLFNELDSKLKKQGMAFEDRDIRVTGSRNAMRKSKLKHVGEIESIGLGAAFLSGKREFVAASVGTGTAIASFKNGLAKHEGGTAVGGGTLEGLSKLLLACNAVEAHALALKGTSRLDKSVKDIVGSGVGLVPGNATASNFGAVRPNASKEDVARSLFNLVGETVGVCASLCAQKTRVKTAVFVGRASVFPLIRKQAQFACRLYGIRAIFPAKSEYATAIGAALL